MKGVAPTARLRLAIIKHLFLPDSSILQEVLVKYQSMTEQDFGTIFHDVTRPYANS